MRERNGLNRGSHLPVLAHLLAITTGPVLELGCGMYSTPFLHWLCHPRRRRLVTVESAPDYYAYARRFETAHHEVWCVTDWDTVDLSGPWSVAFVDHSPSEKRWQSVLRLASVSDYVAAHDAENSQAHKYQYARAHGAYRWRWKYTDTTGPFTAVFSNQHDLRGLTI